MFTVTKQWVLDHSTTGKSGWTREQLAILGYSWPPPSGWLEAIEGIQISSGRRVKFEFLCNREAALEQKIKAEKRYREMEQVVYYTWPTADGWDGSFEKPEGWWR